MTQAESEYVVQYVEAALVNRLIDQCISDGAEKRTATICVQRIIKFVAKRVVQPDLATLTSSEVKDLKKLAVTMNKVADLLDDPNISSKGLLDFVSPSNRLFRASGTLISRDQLVAYLNDYSEAILNEIGQLKLSKGRPPSVHLDPIASFAADSWRKATGRWPALTKNPDDGAPTHELFVCIPIVLDRLPEPYSDLAKGITERALYDAVQRFIRSHGNH